MYSSSRRALLELRSITLLQRTLVSDAAPFLSSFSQPADSDLHSIQHNQRNYSSLPSNSTPRHLTHQFASSNSSTSNTFRPVHQFSHNSSFRGFSSQKLETAAQSSDAVVYQGAFSSAHRWLKRASIVNTIVACVASPFVYLYADMGLIGRVGLSFTLAGFGLLTTGALHWFTSPYVHELKYNPSTEMVRVKGVNLFGRDKWSEFHISDVTASTDLRPTVLFMARGKGYYVDKDNFPDQDLLAKLLPKEEPATPTKGYDDDD